MALLACPRCYRHIGSTALESIDQTANTQQVIKRADERKRLWRAVGGLVVRPVGGNQGLTAVWEDEHEL
jgi:hypothetical protein